MKSKFAAVYKMPKTTIKKKRATSTRKKFSRPKQVDQYEPTGTRLDAIKWVVAKSFCGLFLRPGRGKTGITLAAFKILVKKKFIDKLFVVAPLRVCYQVWPKEIHKWQNFRDLSIGIVHGKNKEQVLEEDHDIYVINPEGLTWLRSWLKPKRHHWFFDNHKWMLCVDESSMFRNNSGRHRNLKSMLGNFYRRLILTGSPAPNGLMGLWGQLYILDRGTRLGSYITAYRNKFFYPSGYEGHDYKLQDGAEEAIYEVIGDIVMHQDNDEDIEPLVINPIQVTLPNKVMKLYEEMREVFIIDIKKHGIVHAVNGAVANSKLRQIANGGIYQGTGKYRKTIHLHDEKTNAALELHEELQGNPLMIAYEFEHDLDRLKKAFPKARVIGGKSKDSQQVEDLWNDGLLDTLLIHPAAGGHGLNLQASNCRDVCWYGLPWDYEWYDQLNHRVWGRGDDTYAVKAHHIIGENTLDYAISRALHYKESVQEALFTALIK